MNHHHDLAERAEGSEGPEPTSSAWGWSQTEGLHITRDLVYGRARIHIHSQPQDRELRLDLYQPSDCQPGDGRPALVMAFGGAFHRGDKRQDEFEQAGQRNTPVSAYCAALARRGYVAASIDYRLVQEDPDPGTTPVIGNPQGIPLSRVAHVRQLLGLPPATAEMVWAGMEAAADDMAQSVAFLQAHAHALGLDATRIAVGGFSAGARTALGCAYGERSPVAAVVSLSGFMADDDLLRLVVPGLPLPPALFITGEHDLDYIAHQAGKLHAHFGQMGLMSQAWIVPGAGHFYAAERRAIDAHGRQATVGEAVVAFLDEVLDADQAAGRRTTRAEASVASTDSATPAPITRP
ncbi:MAG: alpha/beta hydrolase [Rubrivivax sp.]